MKQTLVFLATTGLIVVAAQKQPKRYVQPQTVMDVFDQLSDMDEF